MMHSLKNPKGVGVSMDKYSCVSITHYQRTLENSFELVNNERRMDGFFTTHQMPETVKVRANSCCGISTFKGDK